MHFLRMTGSLLGALSVTLMFCFMAPLMSKKAGELRSELVLPVQISPLLSPVEKPKQRKIIPKKIFQVSRSLQKRTPVKEIMEPVDIRLNPLKIEAIPLMAATLPAPLPVPLPAPQSQSLSKPSPEPVALKPAKTKASKITPAATGIYQVASIDIPPKIKWYNLPLYPPRAKGKGIEGKVVIRCVVSAGGKVRDAKVIQAEPAGYFERAALKSVVKWTFVPAKLKGEKVAVYVDIPLSFSLD